MNDIICPFRKQTMHETKYVIEEFAQCNKHSCKYFKDYTELLPQRKRFEKRETLHEYYCAHPSALKIKRISENHFIYTDMELGSGVLDNE